jgi:hypothetical protein
VACKARDYSAEKARPMRPTGQTHACKTIKTTQIAKRGGKHTYRARRLAHKLSGKHGTVVHFLLLGKRKTLEPATGDRGPTG